jgi:hypothetical protein
MTLSRLIDDDLSPNEAYESLSPSRVVGRRLVDLSATRAVALIADGSEGAG